MLEKYDWLTIQPPVSKTSAASEAARQITSQARVFDVRCEKFYSFCRWAPLLAVIDPLGKAERASQVPAFKLGGPGSDCLDKIQCMRVLKVVAQEVVPDWEQFDYGSHSMKIGRNNDQRATCVATEEQRNRMTMHTASEGRQPYDRADVEAELQLFRAAESVTYTPIETIDRFPSARNEPRPSSYGRKNEVSERVNVQSATSVVDKDIEDLLASGKRVECGADAVERGKLEMGETDELSEEMGAQTSSFRQNQLVPSQLKAQDDEASVSGPMLRASPPVVAVKPAGSMCVECGVVSKNYGLASDPGAKWCRRCALRHAGAVKLMNTAESHSHSTKMYEPEQRANAGAKAAAQLVGARTAAAKFFGGRAPHARVQNAAMWLKVTTDAQISTEVNAAWAELVAHCALKLGRAPSNLAAYTSAMSVEAQLRALGRSDAANILELSVRPVYATGTLTSAERMWVRRSVDKALEQCLGAGPKAALRALGWLAELDQRKWRDKDRAGQENGSPSSL
eukprot:SAG11_NODE_119_length_15911_cov_7.077599_5_plen_510_part_00